MIILGNNTIATGASFGWTFNEANFNILYRPASGSRYIAGEGNTAIRFWIYVPGGSGGDSDLGFALFTLPTAGNPSDAVRIYQDTLTVTSTMKAAPGWYSKNINVDLSAYDGAEIVFAVGGVNSGEVEFVYNWDDTGWQSSAQNNDSNTYPNPWGEVWNDVNEPSAYFEISEAPVPGLRITAIHQPNNDDLVANATGVDAVVFDELGGTQLWQGTVDIVDGDVEIDSDDLGEVDDEVFLVLRWNVGVSPDVHEYTYAATETVIDLGA